MLDYTRNRQGDAPQWTPDGEHIVFSWRSVIYVVPSSGAGRCHWYSWSRGPCQISEDSEMYRVHNFPDLSPDSSRVVYATTRHRSRDHLTGEPTRNYQIEVVSLDGSNRQRLTKEGRLDVSPVWSSDGTRIAHLSSGKGYIATMNPDGSEIRRMSSISYADPEDAQLADLRHGRGQFGLAWSPNNERFAFVAHEVDMSQEHPPFQDVLFTVRRDGSEFTRAFVPPQGHIFGAPAWSPDSRRIAFLTKVENSNYLTLFTALPDGSGLNRVVGVPGSAYYGSKSAGVEWSPDGTQILFSKVGGHGSIHLVNADGTGLRVIGRGLLASWSPDGSRIAVVARGRVYTVAPDGSDRRALW